MGNAWIHPVDATLTWGPLLLAGGLVDQEGYEDIQASAREAERLFNAGHFYNSTMQWAATQQVVFRRTTRVDFYNILTKMEVNLIDNLSAYGKYNNCIIESLTITKIYITQWTSRSTLDGRLEKIPPVDLCQ